MAEKEARTQPGKGGGHRTHLENVGRGYLDRLSPREGRGVAFLGEIALLAVPQSTLAQAAESCELPSLPKKLKSRTAQIHDFYTRIDITGTHRKPAAGQMQNGCEKEMRT